LKKDKIKVIEVTAKNPPRREPIIMSSGCVMLIQVFEKTTHLDDLWVPGYEEWCRDQSVDTEHQAKKFIQQMDDRWTVAFLDSLHDEIEKTVVEHWQEFAPKRLKEEPYKSWYKRHKKRK
jgi:hypothetical protein